MRRRKLRTEDFDSFVSSCAYAGRFGFEEKGRQEVALVLYLYDESGERGFGA